MPSPFPGMNPWLEQDGIWHDFHQTFRHGSNMGRSGRERQGASRR